MNEAISKIDKPTSKLSTEAAEIEFDRFTEEMDLDLNTNDMDAEDLTAFNKNKNRIIAAIKRGALVFNESGEPIYSPWRPNSKHQGAITFHERTGKSLMAMDGKKKNYDVSKTYAVLGEMCREHPNVFAGLAGSDIKLCEALFGLMMD